MKNVAAPSVSGLYRVRVGPSTHTPTLLDDVGRGDLIDYAHGLGTPSTEWQVLTARDADRARPQSLSGVHGRNAFPWHTDGATALHPPRYVILLCEGTDGPVEPTELLDLASEPPLVSLLHKVSLRITDAQGRVRYLPAATRTAHGPIYRWDTRVAQGHPLTRHDEISDALATAEPTLTVEWHARLAIVFNNGHNFHRRPAVRAHQHRRLARLYIY